MREVVHKTVLFLYFVTTLAPLFDYLFNNIRDFLPFLCFLKALFPCTLQRNTSHCTIHFLKEKANPGFTQKSFVCTEFDRVGQGQHSPHRDPHHFCTTSDVCVFNANKNQWALHILWGSNIKKQINSMFH